MLRSQPELCHSQSQKIYHRNTRPSQHTVTHTHTHTPSTTTPTTDNSPQQSIGARGETRTRKFTETSTLLRALPHSILWYLFFYITAKLPTKTAAVLHSLPLHSLYNPKRPILCPTPRARGLIVVLWFTIQ